MLAAIKRFTPRHGSSDLRRAINGSVVDKQTALTGE
jgi:hypothetical protein